MSLNFGDVLSNSISITAFVSIMMVIVEYANVILKGRLNLINKKGTYWQSISGTALGVMPGCLGAFAGVTLYQHGIFSLGAIVSCMIATSGDEAFIMMAMFPKAFVVLTLVMCAVALVTGFVVDAVAKKKFACEGGECRELIYHSSGETTGEGCLSRHHRLGLSKSNAGRWAVIIALVAYIIFIAEKQHSDDLHHIWMDRVSIFAAAVAILISACGSDHFIIEHVWRHVVKRHVPTVFIWVTGTMLAVDSLSSYMDLTQFVRGNEWKLLIIACGVGLIPQSGPHIVFATLFANGALPFSILLANSIVQDGHGALPLLAFDRKEFLKVKLINLAAGLVVGAVAMIFGY